MAYSKDQIEKIRFRIQALRAKTVEAGCTEEEALAAAEMAGKLLDQYNLAEADVAVEERAEMEAGVVDKDTLDPGRIILLATAIADFCNTQAFMTGKHGKGFPVRLSYFGAPGAVELSIYLTKILDAAMFAGWVVHRPNRNMSVPITRARRSFEAGFCARVRHRMRELMAERERHMAEARTSSGQTGTALMVVSKQLVVQNFARFLGMTDEQMQEWEKGRKASSRNRNIDIEAYVAGDAAGKTVHLGTALEGEGQAPVDHKRIGG